MKKRNGNIRMKMVDGLDYFDFDFGSLPGCGVVCVHLGVVRPSLVVV